MEKVIICCFSLKPLKLKAHFTKFPLGCVQLSTKGFSSGGDSFDLSTKGCAIVRVVLIALIISKRFQDKGKTLIYVYMYVIVELGLFRQQR